MINRFACRAAVSPAVVALAAAFLMTAAPQGAWADAVVAKVDGTTITESDLKLLEEELSASLQATPQEKRRETLVNYAVDFMLIVKAAEAKKVQDSPAFKQKLERARERLLMEDLMEQTASEAVKTADLRKIYDDTVKTLAQQQEVRASHILVETEDQAKDLAKQARAGADFAELAKKNSKDPGAADGGDLGYFTKDQMVPEFAEIAFKTAKGQIADPVKTQFGWHVIKVEDVRNRQPPSFDEVKTQIEQFVEHKAQSELVIKLRENAKIERFDTPAPAAPAPKK